MTTPRKASSIVKVATEQSFSKVGDVVHYTIKATNTGSVALTSVLVTDPKVSRLPCTPSVPVASLAVGAEINCTASHTITAADMTAGSFLNTACVDDGASGADQVCSDVTTPRKSLSIVKVATDSSFSKVGDVVHYTIKATNTGSVALTNVLVTDPKVTNLVCTPPVPVASLAVGAEINCTASHTITQADMDAGSFRNTACVDDGATGGRPGLLARDDAEGGTDADEDGQPEPGEVRPRRSGRDVHADGDEHGQHAVDQRDGESTIRF